MTATHPTPHAHRGDPVLSMRGAELTLGGRTLWSGLDLDVHPGEFITVLGANGAGKSSLLKAVLGLVGLSGGEARFQGEPVRRGDRRMAYVPQQRVFPAGTPMRGRDLVALGIDGHRFGPRLFGRGAVRQRVEQVVEDVHAVEYAHRPVGELSGGEQQRLRIAQALVSDPELLLCDEPLSSLDLHHQQEVSLLVDRRRREHGTPVLFVTHDINPVLPLTDRVLYFAGGSHRLGHPDEVMRSDTLSELYGTRVDVAQIGDRIVVLGAPDEHPGARTTPSSPSSASAPTTGAPTSGGTA
ncbi:metal ABC transporter ATP-binding protein [Nocardioides bruguierae]|uniref:ATP-binding cassette domain-containing protein n=1 Tax=Nocardioides bruguierae TaxID=2945102 RepID=A0A9X2IEE4_9ACTN|nr:ATP-binding cassette domain-containing protein [Nocardioides bruguierae]MCM0619269.1 ATP-binding cassette domain-containing protein [Nocardioides bruguierae]